MNDRAAAKRQILPLQLSDVCAPLAELTIVSQHITFAYRIRSISLHFGPNTDFLVRVAPLVAFDPSVSLDGLPSGTPLLAWLSTDPYLLGNDYVIDIGVDMLVKRRSSWLKAHIINDDAFPHTISVSWEIEELEAP